MIHQDNLLIVEQFLPFSNNWFNFYIPVTNYLRDLNRSPPTITGCSILCGHRQEPCRAARRRRPVFIFLVHSFNECHDHWPEHEQFHWPGRLCPCAQPHPLGWNKRQYQYFRTLAENIEDPDWVFLVSFVFKKSAMHLLHHKMFL